MGSVVKFETLSTAKQSEWVDRLFARLWAMYGNRFAQMWAGQDMDAVKAIWRDELADLAPDEIRTGVAACKSRDWPPTLPEFVKLCRPAIDYERAFYDAAEQMRRRENDEDSWVSAALFWAASGLGIDFKNSAYADLKTRWVKAMDDAAKAVRTGEKPDEVPPRRDAIPAPGHTTTAKAEARTRLDEIRAMLTKRRAA